MSDESRNTVPLLGLHDQPARLTARAVLKDRIERLRRRADELETLLKELPAEFSEVADNALWHLVVDAHRQV